MASKTKSRWADDEADAALEAQLKKEKEEKKRLKAEKARKLEAAKQAREAAAAAAQQEGDGANGPPAKRRKVSPERETAQAAGGSDGSANAPKLLRFDGGAFGKSRSVENYDKLNDIEEGAYGWVSRAKEAATGKVVALKRLKIDPKDRGGLPVTGLREIQILKDCDHRNVVKLREVVVGDDTSKIEKYSPPPAPVLASSLIPNVFPASSSSSNSSNTTSSPSSRTCPSPSSRPR
jgi:cell division cycle 2-like protein